MALTVLDAGVVIALLERQDRHHADAELAMRAAIAAGEAFAVPASAYAEVLVRPAASGSAAVAAVDAFIDRLPARIVPVGREIARRAATIRSTKHGVKLPDALVVATADEIGAGRILTTVRSLPGGGSRVDVVEGT